MHYREKMKKVEEIKTIHEYFTNAQGQNDIAYCPKLDSYIPCPRRITLMNRADTEVAMTAKSWGVDQDLIVGLVNIVPEGTKAVLAEIERLE